MMWSMNFDPFCQGSLEKVIKVKLDSLLLPYSSSNAISFSSADVN